MTALALSMDTVPLRSQGGLKVSKVAKFKPKNTYGVFRYFPENALAEALCKLCKQRSLLQADIVLIQEALGIQVELTSVPLKGLNDLGKKPGRKKKTNPTQTEGADESEVQGPGASKSEAKGEEG